MQDLPSLTPPSIAAVEDIFGLYDPPLWLITARAGERRGGLIATSVVRASILAERPRLLIAIAKHHHTWGLIEASGGFSAHLLPSGHLEAVWRFGLATGHRTDKFAGLNPGETPDGHPLYAPALCWMDCRLEQAMDIGDRGACLAGVVGGAILAKGAVLTFGVLRREAPPERKAELDRLYRRDQGIDAAAIQAWQRHRWRD